MDTAIPRAMMLGLKSFIQLVKDKKLHYSLLHYTFF